MKKKRKKKAEKEDPKKQKDLILAAIFSGAPPGPHKCPVGHRKEAQGWLASKKGVYCAHCEVERLLEKTKYKKLTVEISNLRTDLKDLQTRLGHIVSEVLTL